MNNVCKEYVVTHFKAQSRHSPRKAKDAGNPLKIQIRNHSNASLCHYRYISLPLIVGADLNVSRRCVTFVDRLLQCPESRHSDVRNKAGACVYPPDDAGRLAATPDRILLSCCLKDESSEVLSVRQ